MSARAVYVGLGLALFLLLSVAAACTLGIPGVPIDVTPTPAPTLNWDTPGRPPAATPDLTLEVVPIPPVILPPTVPSNPTPVPTATPGPTPTPVATLNPGGRVGLGVYIESSPYDNFAAVEQFEALLKHKMAYVLWFQSWGDDPDFRRDWVLLAAQKGLVPVITWEPWKRDFVAPWAVQPEYALESISAGAHDDYIRSWARAAKETRVPIILRFAHEQSTRVGTRPWYPWQGDPQGYRDAFRHIVTIFREEGADNVRFLWSAMWLQLYAQEYYPGDDVVDIVGTTILNHGLGAKTDWAKWRTFDYLFSNEYLVAQKLGKPVMLTEVATAEQGGDKAAWLRDALDSIRTRYLLVEAILLLEMPVDREWPEINWSVASSPESLAAFRLAISDPTFK